MSIISLNYHIPVLTRNSRHLAICCAANTLLLLQEDIISSLPEYKRREIEHRMDLIRFDLLYVVIGRFYMIA